MKPKNKGLTLIEVVISLSIFTVVAVVLLSHLSIFYSDTNLNKDKIFAYKKANAILSELQAYVDRGEVSAAIDLDALDDGTSYNPTLTISTEGGQLVSPDHPLSGNYQRNGYWVWARRITVRPFKGINNRNVRYITVRIFKRNPNSTYREMAVISSVVNSAGSSYPSTQVYDVFFLAIENVPGWWVYMDAIKPFMEATVNDLEARNPGLKIRTHWITKLSYGRNPRYTPYINKANPSTTDIPYAYYYPGTMPSGSASTYYYVPDNIKARINLDGTIINTASNPPENPNRTGPYYEYTLADTFNNSMRYYDELDLFNRRVQSGDEDSLTPTWRILLEQMATNPDRFHNAIIVNLHGELLPMPPCRNYSDPAKDITNHPYIRVVTHPEKLRFKRESNPNNSEDIKLRVHAFLSDPNQSTTYVDWITLDILCYTIGSDGNIIATDYTPSQAPTIHAETKPSVGTTMTSYINYYSASSPSNPYGVAFLRIRLKGTPVKHTQPSPGKPGLPINCRLYGLEYVPCPMKTGGQFRNLSSTANKPKNTARWIITLQHEELPKDVSGNEQNLVIKVITRIGNANAPDFDWTEAEKENKSVTYAWFADTVEVVPWTERYQFIGDPRHCPYADIMHGGESFPDGYNPYFDDFRTSSYNARSRWLASSSGQFNTSSSNHWPRLKSRWKGRLEIDVPRFTQLLRTALAKSEAVWTTLTGFSYYYLGVGNEIGYDSANGYPSSIPVNGRPWGSSSTKIYVDNISSGGYSTYRYGKILRNSASSSLNKWWGIYWIGELYPDFVWDHGSWCPTGNPEWKVSGNLPTSTWGFNAKYTFYRDRRQDINWNLPQGTKFDATYRRTQAEGCTSVFLCGTNRYHTFHHQFESGKTGDLIDGGLEMASNYSFPLPQTAKISRPFDINTSYNGGLPDEWYHTNAFPHFTAEIVRRYYNHQNGHHGSALVKLIAPVSISNPQRAAFIIVNGLDRTIESGSAFIAKYAVVSLIHSFFEAGNITSGPRIVQLPRVQIKNPTEITELTDPTSIQINYGIEWKRWDGRPYTANTPPNFSEDESSLVYVLMYSKDGGNTWLYIQDDTQATPGKLPSNPSLIINDSGSGDEIYDWPTPPSNFPEGSYLLKVECYRSNEALHYASHMVKFYIDR